MIVLFQQLTSFSFASEGEPEQNSPPTGRQVSSLENTKPVPNLLSFKYQSEQTLLQVPFNMVWVFCINFNSKRTLLFHTCLKV